MSEATAKATRRDLRRAVGPAALNTVRDLEQSVAILQNGVAGAQREIAALAVNHATFKQQADTRMSGLRDALFDFRDRGFLSRLRWLFTGK